MRALKPLRLLSLYSLQLVAATASDSLSKCPGYVASNVKATSSSLNADLTLAGPPCDAYGEDLDNLKLAVEIETPDRIHVKIYDAAEQVYQVPESVFPRPKTEEIHQRDANLRFDFESSPFSFRISRTGTREILFDSSAAGLVIEDQYLRLRTHLPMDANLYGLGEHSDPFKLKTANFTATMWNADMPSIPEGSNLYGSHPIYIEHRLTGSHGVFLLNSNGMDVKINKDSSGQYLEYNTIGGIFDFYFMAGPTPIDVVKQYGQVAGLPATVPYSGLGFHQCRFGYRDAFAVAEVIHNYSKAGIPLETMWTDIDYMDKRAVFTLDPQRFPLKMMREIVDHLHANKQHYVLMVDPAVAAKDVAPYINGVKDDIFLLNSTGQTFFSVVWPGLTAFPDWFAEGVQEYWNNEFANFFSPEHGVDIDFLWIDMNEPASFCEFPCTDVYKSAKNYPPPPPPIRSPPRPLPGWSCDFQPTDAICKRYNPQVHFSEEQFPISDTKNAEKVKTPYEHTAHAGRWKGLPGRDLIFPKYKINNAWGPLPQKSINTSLIHRNGLTLYDTHNLYGSMMSAASRQAMLARRPTKRPFVVTRSTFAGSGSHVSHWLGDNDSDWPHYRFSIRGMLQFNSVFQVSMVGSDVCGFNKHTTEELCARWAMLGAFQPFYRNHNNQDQRDQEFYVWDSVAAAARKAIDIRYRLLDYFYTALMQQSAEGSPAINPMFYLYPQDENTFGLDLQYFYGPSLLVAPVTSEGSTDVDVYLPNDIFYDFYTHKQIRGRGETITLTDLGLSDIPLFLRGGIIVPLRVKSSMTTADLREQDFELIVPVGKDGKAQGTLYMDDGDSLEPKATTHVKFEYEDGRLAVWGKFGYFTKAKLVKITLLTAASPIVIPVDIPLTQGWTLTF